ncbi:sugar nucleotide-binding protein [Arthrobacter castelli]|uniref:sugar nucleotide-binding protein n=1 Tax=Arthrobacter castelli TaxID=271431 RepID=UPI0004185D66|nr:bifunctional dTDP-4-dehydrorhamnose 3,5-epimerase family protein/NAD(P)-dependent oxidoreductase [Arthrobacter castelli]
MSIEFSKALAVESTSIPGLQVIDLAVHGDNRGWFKENWQRAKMTAAGLPDFGPVQNNISFNPAAGTTRGIHAEPWDKYISVASGRIFGAWVDLRRGPTFGNTHTVELDPSKAVFVPRGVGNAFQTLEDDTAYTYLVNDHWSADAQGQYTFLNPADPTAGFEWPIPLQSAQLSDKDRLHPWLADVEPMEGRKILVLGSNGQLGMALRAELGDAATVEYAGHEEFNLAEPSSWPALDWRNYQAIINAAAYTKVDDAEAPGGRRAAWAVNAAALARLADIANANGLTLVHVSSDYVFDGTAAVHDEDEGFSPLNVYGQTKAAGDMAVSTAARHYLIRTSWVVGSGKNFISTMITLAEKGVDPSVVSDQIGRLSFTTDIARGIVHLLDGGAAYGTYNLTNTGPPQSWSDVAKQVFEIVGHDPQRVTPATTEAYYAGKPHAPRPANSVLNLDKLQSTGFTPRSASEALSDYLQVMDTRNE